MKADRYFDITGNDGTTLTLSQASALTDHPSYYDPLGKGDLSSPYYAEAMLEMLQREKLIRSFRVLKKLPPVQPADDECSQ